MINQTSYEKWGDPLKDSSENVVFLILQAIFRLNKRLIDNPDNILKTRIIYEKELNKIANKFSKEWKNWADYDIANAYLDGFNQSESQLKQFGKNIAIIKTIQNGAFLINNPPPVPPVPPIPRQVLKWFDGFENQLTWLGVFRNAAYYTLERQSLQILRVGKDIYRDVAVMAGESSFKEADIFTRRALSQKMLNDYARRGIQTIVYKNGARHSIDDYCEMVGRTMAGRTAVQASLNRFFQSGYTLVIVSSHFRACPLCVPYEGKILSIDKHPVYESVDDATTQGLFHARSYSEGTEVYTNNGWKLIDNVEHKDKILSLNPITHIPEWVNYKKKFKYKPVENEMVEFKSNSFDILVTKDHSMYIGVNSHKEKGEKIVKWKFEEAENCLNKNFKQLRCCNWNGKDLKYDTFGYAKKEFAFLLGIFMSEGTIYKDYIRISQYKKKCIVKIEKYLNPMGFKREKSGFILKNNKLSNYLSTFGKQQFRYIPDYILNENPEIIKIFLDAFLIGDGSTKTTISSKNIHSTSKSYYTTSKKLSEHIGECILKVGKYPSFFISSKKGRVVKHHNGTYTQNYDLIGIRENNSKMSYHNISPSLKHRGIKSNIIKYDGLAYCLELETNHIMWIRRNGKTCWSGNCAHDVSAWFEEITPKKPSVANGEQELIDKYGYNEAQRISYNAQLRQREIERNIRKYKRRLSVSLDPTSQARANQKIKEWQKKQRDHIKENDFLRRKYEREQIRKAY